jgi:hypothetical protein
MAWFNPSDPTSGADIISEEAIANRRKIAEAMARQAAKARPMTSPWQAVAQGFEGLTAGIESRHVDELERSSNSTLADKMAAAFGGAPPAAATAGFATPFPAVADTGPAGSATIAGAGSFNVAPEVKEGLAQTAAALKVDPVDLATLVSYETGGTFSPTQPGPRTQWGQHRGLIQFGEPQAKEHGVDWTNPVGSQLGPDGAIVKYFQKNGAQPGMGLLDLYSIVNAGGPGRYNASDAKNGGAPGTVLDKVRDQMAGHRAKAMALFGSPELRPRPPLSRPARSNQSPVTIRPVWRQTLPHTSGPIPKRHGSFERGLAWRDRRPQISPPLAPRLRKCPATDRALPFLAARAASCRKAERCRTSIRQPAAGLVRRHSRPPISPWICRPWPAPLCRHSLSLGR